MRSFDCMIRLFETILRSLFSFGIWLCTTDFSQEHLFEKSLHYIREKPFFDSQTGNERSFRVYNSFTYRLQNVN